MGHGSRAAIMIGFPGGFDLAVGFGGSESSSKGGIPCVGIQETPTFLAFFGQHIVVGCNELLETHQRREYENGD